MLESYNELVDKIKSLDWKQYFDPFEKDYEGFYKLFKKNYPDVNIDLKILTKIGKALFVGKEPKGIREIIQGNNVAFKCTYNDAGFKGRCAAAIGVQAAAFADGATSMSGGLSYPTPVVTLRLWRG